ncbi:MAG: LCP family protein [Anaerolineae bacterium]|nr:LCP family protein [Anaerolineae bacterium]
MAEHEISTKPHFPRVLRFRRLNWRIVLLFIFITPLCLCGSLTGLYLLFPPPHTDILVLGVDSREGEGWLTRADSIMIVGINPASLQVSMLSIPRDLSVEVPDYGLQRINTVNMLGEMEEAGAGPPLMSAAIAQSFGITTERYVRLDFNGFTRLVDAVGGVTVEVERTIVDDLYPTADGGVMTIRFDPGVQTLNGEQALIYARTRHADDDYRRAERQQQVVSALLGKLINPVYWPSVLSVLNQSVDTNLNVADMVSLALPVVFNRGRIEQLVVDRDYITATADGIAIPNYEKLRPWIEGRFD